MYKLDQTHPILAGQSTPGPFIFDHRLVASTDGRAFEFVVSLRIFECKHKPGQPPKFPYGTIQRQLGGEPGNPLPAAKRGKARKHR